MDGQPLIRVFDTLDAAEAAREALLAAGVDRDDLELRSNDDESGPVEGNWVAADARPPPSGRAGAERAPLAGSGRGGDEYDRRFSRVVQRGTHLLLVLARSESQRQRVEEIVGRCGGHDPQGPAPRPPG